MEVLMRKIVCFCMFVLLATSVFAQGADPVEGFWASYDEKTGEQTGIWKVYQKDGKLYGVTLYVPDLKEGELAFEVKESYEDFPVAGKVNEMTVLNTPWIYNLENKGPGVWANGYIIDPGDGRRYKCKMTFRKADGKKFPVDTLEMRGEIGLGIGRSQFWQKASEEDLKKIK